jgi:hypothetical protein
MCHARRATLAAGEALLTALRIKTMYTTVRETGSSGQMFASQINPLNKATEIFRDWSNRNWTAMMSKLDQDSKQALSAPNGIANFREELKQLNEILKRTGFGWYMVDVCHDQNGQPGIITTQDGQNLLWKSLNDLRFNEIGKWVRWDGQRWAPVA